MHSPGSNAGVFACRQTETCTFRPICHIPLMLLYNLADTDSELIVTLNEKRTLTAGYYLFVFINLVTGAVVNKIYNFTEDESAYPDRFNNFPINPATVFSGQKPGQWRYDVYEQVSSSNTDTTGLTLVEKGLMRLDRVTAFSYAENDQPTTFTEYAG